MEPTVPTELVREGGTRARLVEAARECFARKGVGRTYMEDVAEAAGLARQNVYRYVSGRDELVELAIIERIREFAVELRGGLDPSGDLRTTIVDHVITAVRTARDDPEFGYLTDALSRVRLNFLMSGSVEVHAIVRHSFDPLIKRARMDDALRPDVSEDEMIEWLQAILTFLGPRADLDEGRLRRMIDKFAIPVLLKADGARGSMQNGPTRRGLRSHRSQS